VTRLVTESMNVIGVVSLVILAWDQISSSCRKWRWSLWVFLAMTQAGLFWLHQKVASHVDFAVDGRVIDYTAFYLWHRVYLYVATTQWAIGLVYVALMLRSWTPTSRPTPAPT